MPRLRERSSRLAGILNPRRWRLTGIFFLCLLLPACNEGPARPDPYGPSRPFLMALSSFPAYPAWDAVLQSIDYAAGHADMVVHQHDEGVPWLELSPEGSGNIPEGLRLEIEERVYESRRAGLGIFLATTPMNNSRDGLAPEWNTGSLPSGWEDKNFADPSVIVAYTEWCLLLAELYRPDLFAIVIDANIYEEAHPEDWPFLTSLYDRIYATIKQRLGDIPVFVTFQMEYLQGSLPLGAEPQWRLLDDFTAPQDFLALSTYPSLLGLRSDEIETSYFYDAVSEALNSIDAPVLIAETGYPSEMIFVQGQWLPTSEREQEMYLETLLMAAELLPVQLVTWFYPFDFSATIENDGTRDHFVSMGLNDENTFPKIAFDLWYETWIRPISDN
ncbi:MAG: hypothetical protein KJ970_14365 [Candidatus Eisenbacteria bacterium]|uniref:Arabinogalactan endo-beta-1,4-galactanase n=1 Tax=Eiseniibacteriota bacterium TaxID=2212470 RepID=A0A948RY47_UNCEI|nr:hypothetical protein [Candidatus Eisenbacteria bacterium]MBU1949568.1 hypothetical protein [Candidatus Eisenbacteria bacterium]MBU2692101.1 hypothetical protein [Candidatus Eisenbacteria bacterium]